MLLRAGRLSALAAVAACVAASCMCAVEAQLTDTRPTPTASDTKKEAGGPHDGPNPAHERERYRVRSLPGYAGDMPVPLYSGYMPAPEMDDVPAHYFFWYAAADRSAHPDIADADIPLTVWLQGGPGCTSQFGFFHENGPLRLKGPDQLVRNPHAWVHAPTYMLWLDQPVGTGYSYSDDPAHTVSQEDQLAADFVFVLEHFYRAWPEHRARRLYIFGESYGGYYVTSIAHYIHRHNEMMRHGQQAANAGQQRMHRETATERRREAREQEWLDRWDGRVLTSQSVINLVGIGLGNGAVDDRVQTKSYIDYGFYHGLINEKTATALTERWEHCERASWTISFTDGIGAIDGCMVEQDMLAAALGPNEYDIRIWGVYDFFAHSPIETYFNRPDVQEAAHMIIRRKKGRGGRVAGAFQVKPWQKEAFQREKRTERADGETPRQRRYESLTPQHGEWTPASKLQGGGEYEVWKRPPWATCSTAVGEQMSHDRPISEGFNVQNLLDAGLQMLFYNGLDDVSCNFLGTTRFLEALKWKQAEAFLNAPTFGWKVGADHALDGSRRKEPAADSDETKTGTRATGAGGDGSIVAGYTRSAGPLRLVYVHNSGHLVPMDQPVYAFDLVSRFVYGRSFDDVATPTIGDSLAAGVRGVDAARPVPPTPTPKPTRREWREAEEAPGGGHDAAPDDDTRAFCPEHCLVEGAERARHRGAGGSGVADLAQVGATPAAPAGGGASASTAALLGALVAGAALGFAAARGALPLQARLASGRGDGAPHAYARIGDAEPWSAAAAASSISGQLGDDGERQPLAVAWPAARSTYHEEL